MVTVEVRPFNDRQLNRDLAAVCATVAEARPHRPDGRRLVFMSAGLDNLILDFQQTEVA